MVKTMARVKGPLFSEKASGKFGKEIAFRCGHFVLRAPKPSKEDSSLAQNAQRETFKDAARVWGMTMTSDQRAAWEAFSKAVADQQGVFLIELPFGLVKAGIGRKKEYEECIKTFAFNGYQYFQSCYLQFGPDGWMGYPNPPALP